MKNSTQTIDLKNRMIAEEISFAKVLAGNDKKLRDRAVKKLIKWLAVRSKGKTAFTEENFQRIWSGLFYCMWMSDKFLIQEELAESISKLVHCFRNNDKSGLLFIKGFFKIMGLEWSGIDQHRIDKFCMLIRRFLRQTLEFCNRKDWDVTLVKSLTAIFEETVINEDVPNGYLVHFVDIFLEELSKVSKGKVESKIILTFLEPFIKITATTKDSRVHRAIALLFDHLIKQTDIGIEYEEKLRAWKELKMPCEKPEELELTLDNSQEEEGDDKDSELDEMMEETALDPRAGKVDAILPQLPTDFNEILILIRKYQKNNSITNTGRRELNVLENKFIKLKHGKMPEFIRKPKILLEHKKKRRHTSKCVKELIEYTKKLDEDIDLDLACDEIDSDEEVNDTESEPLEKDNSRTTREDSQTEDSPSPVMEKVKLKSNEKIKKKMKSSKLAEKENKGEKKEIKKKKAANKNKTEKTKPKEKKDVKTLKPKSPKETFKVEDVNTVSDSLITTNKKRKLSDSWIVHDIDNEEDNKIITPKIIRIETKTNRTPTDEVIESVKTEDCDPPVKNETPQLKLTAAFWEKAKQKAFKKKKNLVPNPLYVDQSKNSRRISFALDRNEAQENDEYLNEVRNSPNIPFDGTRKPIQSALKSGLSPSPINPFYRFKKFH